MASNIKKYIETHSGEIFEFFNEGRGGYYRNSLFRSKDEVRRIWYEEENDDYIKTTEVYGYSPFYLKDMDMLLKQQYEALKSQLDRNIIYGEEKP